MTEQNQATADVDDTEGHVHFRPAEDTAGYQGTEDDVQGHMRHRDDDADDDTEGHIRQRDDADDDTEGHVRHRDDADGDDTEGHMRH